MLGAFQPWHLIVVLVIVLMVFGPGKLPEVGRAVGDGLRELKKATGGESSPSDASTHAASTSAPAAGTSSTAVPNGHVAGTRPCPKCNTAVPLGDKFCGACGNAMETAAPRA